jgi:Flp pilus assembly pilin Flp
VGKKILKQNNSGQAIVEYILLLSIVVGIFVVVLPKLSASVDGTTTAISSKIETQLQTGMSSTKSLWTK